MTTAGLSAKLGEKRNTGVWRVNYHFVSIEKGIVLKHGTPQNVTISECLHSKFQRDSFMFTMPLALYLSVTLSVC